MRDYHKKTIQIIFICLCIVSILNPYFSRWKNQKDKLYIVKAQEHEKKDLEVKKIPLLAPIVITQEGYTTTVDGVANTFVPYQGTYEIYSNGTPCKNFIVVESGTHFITIKDLNINMKQQPLLEEETAPISILNNAAVTLFLEETNFLYSQENKAAIYVSEHAFLTVEEKNSNDTVLKTASVNGAAIGGNNGEKNGTIIINSGVIFADSINGACIGSGTMAAGTGTITINGGTLQTMQSERKERTGAFIGGGCGTSGGNIIINGGTIYARAKTSNQYTYSGAIIGGGKGGDSGTIVIHDGYLQLESAIQYSVKRVSTALENSSTCSLQGTRRELNYDEQVHLRYDYGEDTEHLRNYDCDLCDKFVFSMAYNSEEHNYTCEWGEPCSCLFYYCLECGWSFPNDASYLEHYQSVCSQCGSVHNLDYSSHYTESAAIFTARKGAGIGSGQGGYVESITVFGGTILGNNVLIGETPKQYASYFASSGAFIGSGQEGGAGKIKILGGTIQTDGTVSIKGDSFFISDTKHNEEIQDYILSQCAENKAAVIGCGDAKKQINEMHISLFGGRILTNGVIGSTVDTNNITITRKGGSIFNVEGKMESYNAVQCLPRLEANYYPCIITLSQIASNQAVVIKTPGSFCSVTNEKGELLLWLLEGTHKLELLADDKIYTGIVNQQINEIGKEQLFSTSSIDLTNQSVLLSEEGCWMNGIKENKNYDIYVITGETKQNQVQIIGGYHQLVAVDILSEAEPLIQITQHAKVSLKLSGHHRWSRTEKKSPSIFIEEGSNLILEQETQDYYIDSINKEANVTAIDNTPLFLCKLETPFLNSTIKMVLTSKQNEKIEQIVTTDEKGYLTRFLPAGTYEIQMWEGKELIQYCNTIVVSQHNRTYPAEEGIILLDITKGDISFSSQLNSQGQKITTITQGNTNVSYIGEGNVTIKGNHIKTDHIITVESGESSFSIENIDICSDTKSPIDIMPNSNAVIEIKGENCLINQGKGAGIHIPDSSSVTLWGEGTIDVTGGHLAAGIGGNELEKSGDIVLEHIKGSVTGGKEAKDIGNGAYEEEETGEIIVNNSQIQADRWNETIKDKEGELLQKVTIYSTIFSSKVSVIYNNITISATTNEQGVLSLFLPKDVLKLSIITENQCNWFIYQNGEWIEEIEQEDKKDENEEEKGDKSEENKKDENEEEEENKNEENKKDENEEEKGDKNEENKKDENEEEKENKNEENKKDENEEEKGDKSEENKKDENEEEKGDKNEENKKDENEEEEGDKNEENKKDEIEEEKETNSSTGIVKIPSSTIIENQIPQKQVNQRENRNDITPKIEIESNLEGFGITQKKNTYQLITNKNIVITIREKEDKNNQWSYQIIPKGVKYRKENSWRKLKNNKIKITKKQLTARIYMKVISSNHLETIVKTTGFQLDKKKPQIKEVKNNDSSAVTIHIVDKQSGIKNVFLNGKEIESSFTLSKKGIYTITAIDRAGNKSKKQFIIK